MPRFFCILALALLGLFAVRGDAASLAARESSTVPPPGKPQPAAAPPIAAKNASAILASVNGAAITLGDVQQPLLEAYGLEFVLHLVQTTYYRDQARKADVTVTAKDIADARERFMENVFGPAMPLDEQPGANEAEKKANRLKAMEAAMPQLFSARHIAQPEFDWEMENDAIAWKIALKKAPETIDDKWLEQAYLVTYGEKVRVRDIQLSTREKLTEAQRRVEAGEDFGAVAKSMSEDLNSKPYGGELRPFTRGDPNLITAFKDLAFSMKPGQVETLNIEQSHHLIKLEERIAPQHIEFKEVKESLRNQFTGVFAGVQAQFLRKQFDAEVRDKMQIEDAGLKWRYDEKVKQAGGQGGQNGAAREPESSNQSGPGVAQPPAIQPGK